MKELLLLCLLGMMIWDSGGVLFLMKKRPLLFLLQMKLKAVEEQQEESDFDLEVEDEYEGMFLSSLRCVSVNDHKISLMKFPLLVKNNASVLVDQETRMTKSDFQYLAKNSLDWRLTVYK